MSKLVANTAQVEENAMRFAEELEASPGLQDRLSFARAWYAFPSAEGGWRYVPSKFGGYRGMTAEQYLDDEPRDGRRTERQLGQWFVEVPEDGDLHDELYDGLTAFLDKYGKSPSAKARVNVLAKIYNERMHGATSHASDSALVDLMLIVARKLPRTELVRLRDSL